MNILVLLQNIDSVGGTNLLLNKYSSWMRKNKNCNVLEFKGNLKEDVLKDVEWDLVVLPTSQIDTLMKLKFKSVKFNKILIWSLGHNAFTEAFISGRIVTYNENIIYKIINKFKTLFLNKLIERNSIIFSDEVSLNSEINILNLNNQNLEDLIFPIIINKEKRLYFQNQTLNKKNIRCTWTGRVDKDFKLIIILKLISELKNITKDINIKFNLIGTGDSIDIVIEELKHSGIEYEHIEFIPYKELHQEIIKITDISFSMGTSSLDTAKVAIPTVVLQPLRENQDIYSLDTYRWIYESKGFSLGEFANKKTIPMQINKSIKEIINDYLNDEKLADKCFKYCEFFYIDNVLNKLYQSKKPKRMDTTLWFLIFFTYLFKKIKIIIKSFR